MEDGFGPLTLSADEAIEEIIKLIKNDFRMEEKYSEKMKDMFFYNDDSQRERVYRALISMKEDGYSIK